MTETLANENLEVESEGNEIPKETPTENPEPKPQSTYVDLNKLPEEQRGVVQAKLGEMTRKHHETEAKNRKLADQNKALEKQILDLQKPKEVPAPKIDDAVDYPEQFQAQLDAHNEYQRKAAEYEAQQEALKARLALEQKDEQNRQEAEFGQKAADAGVDILKANHASNVVANVLEEASPQLASLVSEELLKSEKSIEMIVSLAENPMKLYDLISGSPTDAVRKLDQLANTFSQTQKPIDPPEDLKGGSAPEETEFIASWD